MRVYRKKKKRKPCVSLNISNNSVRWAGPTSFTIMLKYKQALKSQASTQEVHVESLWSTAKKFWYMSVNKQDATYTLIRVLIYTYFSTQNLISHLLSNSYWDSWVDFLSVNVTLPGEETKSSS